MLKRVVAISARIVVAAVILGAALAKAAADVGWWKANDLLTWVLVGIPSVVVFIAAIADAARVYRAPTVEKRRRELSFALRGLALTAGDLSSISERFFGANVFLIKGRRLRRVSHERFNPHPLPSVVQWTSRKGAVGQAIRTSRSVAIDVARDYPVLSAVTAEQDFAALPDNEKDGFTWNDWSALRQKYIAVLAVPLFDETGTKVIGAISVDLPDDPVTSGHGNVFDDPSIVGAAEATSQLVTQFLAR